MEKTLQQEENRSDSQSLKTQDCWKLIEHFEEFLVHACPVLTHLFRHLLLVTVPRVDSLV